MKIWIDHHIQIILVFMLFSGGICSGWERNHKRDTALVSNTWKDDSESEHYYRWVYSQTVQ